MLLADKWHIVLFAARVGPEPATPQEFIPDDFVEVGNVFTEQTLISVPAEGTGSGQSRII